MPQDFQPTDRPRIIEIENPNGSHFVVGVVIDPKFMEVGTCPDFGSVISDVIDPSYVDDRYSGMVFTEIRPNKGDFLMIFQKLSGSLLAGNHSAGGCTGNLG